MAAPSHVGEDSTADLSTQHGRPLSAARPVLSSETRLPKKEGHVSEDSTGCAALRGLPFCIERSAMLSSATLLGAAMETLYLILNNIKFTS